MNEEELKMHEESFNKLLEKLEQRFIEAEEHAEKIRDLYREGKIFANGKGKPDLRLRRYNSLY